MFPASEKLSRINFPKRLELLLYTVFALPNASRMGLDKGEESHTGMREEGDAWEGEREDKYFISVCVHVCCVHRGERGMEG